MPRDKDYEQEPELNPDYELDNDHEDDFDYEQEGLSLPVQL